jgi:adenosylcobinamide hydrolase
LTTSRAASAEMHLPAGPRARPVLVWRLGRPTMTLSSAPVGGGWQCLDWLANVEVERSYGRTDLEAHAADVASGLGLAGAGATLFTAADVTRCVRADDTEVAVDATVGITVPTWAAAPDGELTPWSPGTINIVVQLPVTLAPAAAVNAVVTATEAKAQALFESGVPGTGTASDAIVVCWPLDGAAEPFAGPRSLWGGRLARAVHRAVATGITGIGDRR